MEGALLRPLPVGRAGYDARRLGVCLLRRRRPARRRPAALSRTVGNVHALAANLEAELARRSAGTGNAQAVKERINRNRGRRVASRFLSGASAAFARNRPVLAALRQRYRLGVVSNFYGNLEAVCHSAGLASLFAVKADSHCVGADKPDPAIFRAALKTLRAMPETTAFVGDSLRRDREGARCAGTCFIWIAPQDVQAAEVRTSAEPLVHWRWPFPCRSAFASWPSVCPVFLFGSGSKGGTCCAGARILRS